MNFKKVIVLLGASIVFLLSTLVSWYEGGQLRDISWEWKYTAIFSNWFNGEVISSSEILTVDHFVYAAKFEPFCPLLMAASMIVIIFQVTLWLTSDRKTIRNVSFLFIAILSFAVSLVAFNSPTTGLQLFSIFFVIVGILSLLIVFLFKSKRQQSVTSEV